MKDALLAGCENDPFHRPVGQASQLRSKHGSHFHRGVAFGVDEFAGAANEARVVGDIGEERISRIERGGTFDIESKAVGSVRRREGPWAAANNSNGLTSAGRHVNGRFPVEVAVAQERNLRHTINRVAKDAGIGRGHEGKCVAGGDPDSAGVNPVVIVCTQGRRASDQGSACDSESEGWKELFSHRVAWVCCSFRRRPPGRCTNQYGSPHEIPRRGASINSSLQPGEQKTSVVLYIHVRFG
jgi:hypothetical protein